MRLAHENLLPCGAIFAVQQTNFCCTANRTLLHGRFSRATGKFSKATRYFKFHLIISKLQKTTIKKRKGEKRRAYEKKTIDSTRFCK